MKKLLLASLCFLLLCASQLYAQNRTVTGTVTSKDDGLPLPGVTVQVVGTKIGTQTNASGKFVVNAPASARSLTFSFIGYQSQTVTIGSGPVNVVLVSATNQLSEVVVSAGGIAVTRASQGYTSTTVKAQELTQGKATNVAAALSGKVAGLQVNVVSSGVNPNVRLVLRGNRSLLGNNQALIVVDNQIVPNSLLANINPEDIEDIQVLNGAGAAALYGSDASNGALLITTKKGKRGQSTVNVSHTTQLEQVSYFPKLQGSFGSGSANDVQEYVTYENQQYGPAFDGSMVQIGKPISTGAIQTVPYSPNNSKYDFWKTGLQNQTDFSLSSGDEKGTTYISGQYVSQNGTTVYDRYSRAGVRANGTRDLGNGVSLSYNTNFIQNRYDQTSATANMYDQLLQTPAHVNINEYEDWRNNPFASPDGYYNEYYDNPYFTLGANRSKTRNDYLSGVIELKWAPASFLSFTLRPGITTQNQSYKNTSEKYVLSPYTKSIGTAAVKTNDRVGGVTDGSFFATSMITDLFGTFNKKYGDVNVNFLAGAQIRNNTSKSQNIGASGLVQNGLFNVGERFTPNVSGGESNATVRQQGVYGSLTLGYKDFLTVHVTGRNDWLSVLAPENRSFFYPAADVAFIPTEAFDWLKGSKVISNLKIRAGVSKVGQANIGAYALKTTFGQASGYPFVSGPGYGLDGRIVSLSLRPEITKSFEAGFDADWWDNRINTSITYYNTSTTDQTVPTGVSLATGFSSYLVNTGEVTNTGIESAVTITTFKNANWTVNVGGNFTYLKNNVKAISSDLSRLALSTGGTAQTYAIAGQPFPTLLGADYARDDQGRVIVDAVTGYPSANPVQVLLGNTNPKYRLGLNTEIKYKSIRFTALAEYRGGFVIYNNGASTYDFSGAGLRTVYYNRERFVFPNSSYLDPATNTYVANTNVTVSDGGAGFFADNNRNMNVASNYIYDGSSWKLREVALSYDLPKSLLGKQKYIKGARISAQGRNLFLWVPNANIYTDPEFNFTDGNAIGITTLGQTPPTRIYSATLSLTF